LRIRFREPIHKLEIIKLQTTKWRNYLKECSRSRHSVELLLLRRQILGGSWFKSNPGKKLTRPQLNQESGCDNSPSYTEGLREEDCGPGPHGEKSWDFI
jgi:hypothetical protein